MGKRTGTQETVKQEWPAIQERIDTGMGYSEIAKWLITKFKEPGRTYGGFRRAISAVAIQRGVRRHITLHKRTRHHPPAKADILRDVEDVITSNLAPHLKRRMIHDLVEQDR